MPIITVLPGGTEFAYRPGPTLLELLLDHSTTIENPCNGRGLCGKCKVRHLDGELPDPTSAERQHLTQKEQEGRIRLACLVHPEHDISIATNQSEKNNRILVGGAVPDFEFAPTIHKKTISVSKPSLDAQMPFEEMFSQVAGTETLNIQMLKKLSAAESAYTAVLSDGVLLAIEPGDTADKLYGLAIDIGTTTVVVSLVDLNNGEILGSATAINAQKIYGLDVLSRITYIMENPETGAKKLQRAIVECLNGLIAQLCGDSGVSTEHIYNITAAANPTMMHMLLGVDASPLGVSPFAPVFVKARNVAAADIGLLGSENCQLYCLPGVSAYVGSDIVAGVYVSGLAEESGSALFIDIGTNGEIVVNHKGVLISCSCAAGPALEGMNISAGVRAAAGAIENVTFNQTSFEIAAIDGEKPSGICGSGIISAVSALLSGGFLKSGGMLRRIEEFDDGDCRRDFLWQEGRNRGVRIYEDISITQRDVRQVQLAKGAISSGFCALLEIAGLEMRNLGRVVIAGQFGAHLDAGSLIGIGLLPREASGKITYIGNSSHTGAYLALVSKPSRAAMENLAPRITYKELSVLPGFERIFRNSLEFPSGTDGAS